jgi:hypothetical protein
MRVVSVAGRPTPSYRRLVCCLVLLGAVLCPACSSDRKPVYPVKGQVLVNGKPAANAQVLFHPTDGASEELKPTGQTDDEGYFTLTSYKNGDGAPEGSYNVTVTWFRVGRSGNQANAEIIRYNALPLRYAKPTTSQLQASVSKGDNELPPLQLSLR